MRQKLILIILSLSLLTTGCALGEDSKIVDQGKEALENHKYEDAIKLFTSALDENSSDEHARAMYKQARGLLNVDKYEKQGNLDKAIKELEIVEKIKGGSSSIKSEVSSRKKELERLYEEQTKAIREKKEEAKNAVSKDKYRLEQQAIELQRKEEEKKNQEEEALKKEQENQTQENQTQEPTNPGINDIIPQIQPPTNNNQ